MQYLLPFRPVPKLDQAKTQLQTENYSRMVVYLDLPEESEETYALLDQIHTIAD